MGNYDFSYINRTYGLSAKRNGRVIAYGKPGKIVAASLDGAYLLVRLVGARHAMVYHPTDGIVYVSDVEGSALDHDVDDVDDDRYPFCQCQLEYVEDELASNTCSACGKEIE